MTCVKADGSVWEHEHADHATYLFPVDVEWVGAVTDDMRADYKIMTGKEPPDDAAVRDIHLERHALIYTDGIMAVTLYETCYAMFNARSGEARFGRYVYPEQQKLSKESLERIQAKNGPPAECKPVPEP